MSRIMVMTFVAMTTQIKNIPMIFPVPGTTSVSQNVMSYYMYNDLRYVHLGLGTKPGESTPNRQG